MTLLLSCRNLTKSYSAHTLFDGITLGLTDTDRMGLIGPNGSGKSTFLKILAGLEPTDEGELSRKRDLRLAYVAQDDPLPDNKTVTEILEEALRTLPLEDYEQTARLNAALTRFGFADPMQAVRTLSGGWKKRLALAEALIRDPDLLLLDEPTNHLDLEGVLWLENLLQNASFAYLLVSHDRYFLENVANRITELNRAYPEGYLSIEGSYSGFLAKKEEFLNAQQQQQVALSTKVKREIEWLSRSAPARTTKASARIQEAHRLIEELADVKFRNSQDRAVEIDFSATQRKTREMLGAKDLSMSLGGRTLFSHLNIALSPGTKLGLLGPNGSGKTTLLRLLTGEIAPDAGAIKRADGLRIVRFEQDRSSLDRDQTLRLALSPNGDTVTYRGGSMHIAGWARRFLFLPEQLDRPISSLSGGEQARILIAQLMLQPADLLILDEPTNDLDIPSLEVLEDSLSDFPGAVVLVTHDRYMLDRISTLMLALDGAGGSHYFADYAQWERAQEERQAEAERNCGGQPDVKPAAARPQGLNAQERRELGRIEETILAAEEEVASLQRRMEDPEVASDAHKLQECWHACQAAQERVAGLYARWEELEAKQNAGRKAGA